LAYYWFSDFNTLGRINAKLQRVYLVCSVLSSYVAGYYLEGTLSQLKPAFILVGSISLVSFIVKYICLECICAAVPALIFTQLGTDNDGNEGNGEETVGEDEEPRHCTCCMVGSYAVYFQQDISAGGFAISLLYLNVMIPGDIMTSYLLWRGLSLHWLGVIRAAAAVAGVLGTVLYDWSLLRYPLRATATASIGFMAACLSLSVVGIFFISSEKLSLSMLVGGVIMSRVGLQADDLAIRQLSQHTIPETVRCIVGGSQNSLNAFFSAMQYVSGVAWHDPSQFHILCLVGYLSVIASFFLTLRGVYFSAALSPFPSQPTTASFPTMANAAPCIS
jgi:hypothetical protein